MADRWAAHGAGRSAPTAPSTVATTAASAPASGRRPARSSPLAACTMRHDGGQVPGHGHAGAEGAVGLAARDERLQAAEDGPVPSPQCVVALRLVDPDDRVIAAEGPPRRPDHPRQRIGRLAPGRGPPPR